MHNLLYKIKKIPNYIGRFGIINGFIIFLKIEWIVNQHPNQHICVNVPGYSAPICMRSTIQDHSAFWICLVAEQYSVMPFPQKERLSAVYKKLLAEGKRPLIIDAGANIGMSALWYARMYPEAKIFAIEPNHENYELLVKNTRTVEQITPFYGGVWPRNVGLIIENPDAGSQHYRTREVPMDIDGSLNAITIDTILSKTDSDEIFIAKIDIEGGQDSLFEENTLWVEKTNLIVLELDDWQFPWKGTSRSFFSCVSKYPFDYLLHGENIFCFQDLSLQNNMKRSLKN